MFDFPYDISTKYNEHYIINNGFIVLEFVGIPVDSIDNIISEFGEIIKHKYKEHYSINRYGYSCYDKPKWYRPKIHPIHMFNFRRVHDNTTLFKNDQICFDPDLYIRLVIDKNFIEENRKNTYEKLDVE